MHTWSTPTMESRSREQYAARVRAARAYAAISQGELAHALGLSQPTMKRIEAGERAVDAEERRVIADRCGVPRAFLEAGWEATETLERAHDALRDELIGEFSQRLDQMIASFPLGEQRDHESGPPEPPRPSQAGAPRRRRRRGPPPT